jgi:hypothetical protein
VTASLLLIHALIVTTVIFSGDLQQWLVPAIRPYFPALQSYLPPVVQDIKSTSDTKKQLKPEDLLKACSTHQYTTEIISTDPMLIYINNFTSAQEAEELINLGCVHPLPLLCHIPLRFRTRPLTPD